MTIWVVSTYEGVSLGWVNTLDEAKAYCRSITPEYWQDSINWLGHADSSVYYGIIEEFEEKFGSAYWFLEQLPKLGE